MLAYGDRRRTLRWAKIGAPRRGCPEQPRGSVASLAVAPGPGCAPRLPMELLRSIAVMQSSVIWL